MLITTLFVLTSYCFVHALQAVEVCPARTINFTSGLIVTSPNYPKNYNTSTNCFLTIVLPTVSNVTFTFSRMDLESSSSCLYDKLLISGRNETKMFCGATLPEAYTIGLVAVVGMHFTTDVSVERTGFHVVLVHEAVYPYKPSNLRITMKTSRAVTFSWTAPTDGGDGGLTHYVIKITADANVVRNYTLVKASNSCTAANLIPNTDYIMSIVAQNKHGFSNATYLEFTTDEDVPDGPPLDVKVVALDSSSLNISWREPEKTKQNGAIVFYGVCVSFQQTNPCNKTFTTENNMLTVSDLNPSTLYYVKVRASTSVGYGPYSNYTARRTNIAVYPDEPSNLKITKKTSRSVTFSWTAPKDEGDGGLTRYVIKITADGNVIHNYFVTKASNSSTATNLIPNTDYMMSIVAQSKHGFSNVTYLEFTTDEDVPDGPPLDVEVVALNSSSLSIAWSKPEENKQNGVVIKYIVCVSLQSGDCIKSFVTTEGILTVNNLHPHTLYYVKVQASTRVGGGPYSDYTIERTNIEPLLPPTNATNTTLAFTLHKPSFYFSSYIIVAIKLKEKAISNNPTKTYRDEDFKSYAESQSSTIPQPYIAAEVSVSRYKSFIFTLGARTTKCDCTQRSGKLAYVEYYNGPLEPDEYYSVFQRFYYKGDHFSTDWSIPAKTKSTPEMALVKPSKKDTLDSAKSENKWYIIVITFFCGLIIGIGVTLVAVKIRQLGSNQGAKPQDEYAEADPQEDVNDSLYQELDLKDMKEENVYQNLKKNIPIAKENKEVYKDENVYETPDV